MPLRVNVFALDNSGFRRMCTSNIPPHGKTDAITGHSSETMPCKKHQSYQQRHVTLAHSFCPAQISHMGHWLLLQRFVIVQSAEKGLQRFGFALWWWIKWAHIWSLAGPLEPSWIKENKSREAHHSWMWANQLTDCDFVRSWQTSPQSC